MAIPILATIWLTVGLSSVSSSAEPRPTIQDYVSRAEADFLADKFDMAEQNWRLAEALARIELGNLALVAGDGKEAVSLLTRAAPVFNKSEEFAVQLAEAYDAAGQSKEAIESLRAFLIQSPRSYVARRTLGELLAKDGQTSDALAEFRRALLIAPHDRECVFMTASALLKLKDLQGARSEFALLSEIAPGAATEVLVGRMYRDFGFDDEARAHLQRALRIDPTVQHAHYYLGTLCVLREGSVDLKCAASEFKQELTRYPMEYLGNLYLGVVLVQDRAYAEALPHLERAATIEPSMPDSYGYLAQSYLEQRRYEESIAAARKAIFLTVDESKDHYRIANTHYILAQALRGIGDSTEALKEFAQVQRLKAKDNSSAKEELSSYLREADDNSSTDGTIAVRLRWAPRTQTESNSAEAASHLSELLANIQFHLGVLYIRESRFADAASEFDDLYQRDSAYPELGKNYGLSLLKTNRAPQASIILKKLLESSPGDQEAIQLLGQAYFAQDDYANTVSTLTGHQWHDIPTQYALAVSLARMNDQEDATRAFRSLLSEHADSAELKALLGQAAEKEKNYSEAVQYYQSALALDPSTPEVHFGLGMISLRNGEFKKAEEHFRAELTKHPKDVRDEYYLAYVLGLEQSYDEAEAILRRILSDHPDFPEAHMSLGSDLLAQHRAQEALDELLAAEKLDPKNAKLEYQIGIAYRSLGRSAAAQEAFARFRQLQTN